MLAALALAGCMTVGPDYHPPETAVPAAWQAAAAAPAPAPEVLAQWWREFGDPVLDGLVADALAANLDLASAGARLREARERRALAGAQLGPSVSASASASRSRSSAATGGGGARELYSAGFDASWEPDVFGGLRRGVEAAEADAGASEESLRDTRVSLLAEVALNYLDLRTAERRLAVAEASLLARAETQRLTQWRLQAGLVSELDAAQALTELESARAGLPPLHTAIAEARNRLGVLLGQPPGGLGGRLAATAAVPVAQGGLFAGIPADVMRQRPDVRRAERQLAAQTARLGEAQAARWPGFSLSGSIGLEALSLGALDGGGALARSLLAGLTVPVFDAGRIAASIGIQDALLEQAQLAYRAAVLGALEDVENALTALAQAGERRDRLAEAVGAARSTLQIAEQRYASGLVDFLAVLDAQRTLLSLEDQLATGTGDLARAQVQLYKALGGGWSQAAGGAPETGSHS